MPKSLFCESETELFRKWAKCLAEWSSPSDPGTEDPDNPGESSGSALSYYARDRSGGYDPLYRESKSAVWRGPWSFPATIEFEEAEGHYEQDVLEEGVDRIYDAIMSIDYLSWDEKVVKAGSPGFAEPHEGDVVSFFNGDRYYEVEKVERYGYVLTSDQFTGWKLLLRKRDSFDPSRKLT